MPATAIQPSSPRALGGSSNVKIGLGLSTATTTATTTTTTTIKMASTPLEVVPRISPAAAPSPNYFALVRDASNQPTGSSSALAADPSWSQIPVPMHAMAARSPQLVRHDPRSEFEAFRRRSDPRTATLTLPQTGAAPSPLGTKATDPSARPTSPPALHSSRRRASPANDPMELSPAPAADLASFRTSSTLTPTQIVGEPRYDSIASAVASPKSSHHQQHSRLSLPAARSGPASRITSHENTRAVTLPGGVVRDGLSLLAAPDLAHLLTSGQELLLLDVRVQQQFARARITGSLNLCIPTTLLKRPSFNLLKLAGTFTDPTLRARFQRGRESRIIVAYDDRSTTEKEAASSVSTLKKFTNEGWQGQACILNGGFALFAKQYPNLVDEGSNAKDGSASVPPNARRPSHQGSGPVTAPVAGGCPMPARSSAANPFFGNIRQNMDLLGGVGQIRVRRPPQLAREGEIKLPRWLMAVTDERNQGETIAKQFLHVERAEQRRMQEALSGRIDSDQARDRKVRIAGIEEGTRNRYNNIWPYDHTRVKLNDRSDGMSDYINANYIKASWSNKRYIATQGPMPATFRDFWNLVWEQDVRVIVMLTAEHEGGQLKCHPYWTEREIGPFRLKPISERKLSLESPRATTKTTGLGGIHVNVRDGEGSSPISSSAEPAYAIVRTFSLSHTSHPFVPMREITQLHLATWLDFDTPSHPSHVLNLIEQCDSVVRASNNNYHHFPYQQNQQNQQQQQQQQRHLNLQHGLPFPSVSRPILVHCSAGCGRTGTFCTIDSVLDMLRRQRVEQARRSHRGGDVDPFSSGPGKGKEMVPSTPPPLDRGIYCHDDDCDDAKMEEADDQEDWVFRDDIDLIAQTVKQLRTQRISMVQSLRQYVLCYEAVLEWFAHHQSRHRRHRSSTSSTLQSPSLSSPLQETGMGSASSPPPSPPLPASVPRVAATGTTGISTTSTTGMGSKGGNIATLGRGSTTPSSTASTPAGTKKKIKK